MKTTLEYVISAAGQGFFPSNQDLNDAQYEAYKQGVIAATKIVQENTLAECTNYTPKLSALYNAYTEKGSLPIFHKLGKMGLKTFYADSGGLQMVTAGKEITEEIKKKIYFIQTYANYAMCFDEIPLSRVSEKRTRNERSNNANKIYHPENLLAAAIQTGKNVKTQIDTFRVLKAKTKVVLIVQGNTWQDMVLFYEKIAEQLQPEDWDYVDGLAVADTCIGNGEFESIEMIRAAKFIGEISHPNVRRHLHILGVGSIPRMAPFIYLKRSGYLDNYEHISYDSSSHSSTFTYGLMKLDGTCKSLGEGSGSVRTRASIEKFGHIYELFGSYLQQHVTFAKFIDIIHGPDNHEFGKNTTWTHSAIKERSMNAKDDTEILIGHLIKPMYVLYQIDNFMKALNGLWVVPNNNSPHEPMKQLIDIKDDKQLLEWKQKNESNKKVKSKRIKRKNEISSLDAFL